MFGPDRKEVTRRMDKISNEELHNLHSSLNITRVIKLGKVRWTSHVARIGR
jgi:hypothetical protein